MNNYAKFEPMSLLPANLVGIDSFFIFQEENKWKKVELRYFQI